MTIAACENVLLLKSRHGSLNGTGRCEMVFFDKLTTCRLDVLSGPLYP